MKKSIFFFVLGLIAFSANAQKMSKAPLAVETSFTKLHPNAHVDKWEQEGNNWEAEFKENGVETSVEFGPNGQLIATEVEIKVTDLPKAIDTYCTTNMPGKKIKEASKITSASGTVTYEAEVDESDYLFDSNGSFLKKEVEKDDDQK